MFALIERVMNGTVTLNIYVTCFNFKTFEEAVNKVKETLVGRKFGIITNDDHEFSYVFAGEFPLCGSIRNEEIRVFN
jgi:hypothetical protein